MKVHVHPGAEGSGFVFRNTIMPNAIPAQFIPAIEEGLRKAARECLVLRFEDAASIVIPLEDVEVELYDGSYHEVDSSEDAFKFAAANAFYDAVHNAGPVTDTFDDDPASSVREPRKPAPTRLTSGVALPEPDDGDVP